MGSKAKPCPDCGGPKDPGRGRRWCNTCTERRQPIILQAERQRQRIKEEQKRRANGKPIRRTYKDAPEGQAWCGRCGQYLPKDRFASDPRRKSGVSTYCRPCQSDYLHNHQLRKSFGIDGDHYYQLLSQQDGRCAICLSMPRTRRLAVDHNHKTGEIRGLLCTRCNHKLIGAAHERADILRRAADYLDNPPARNLQEVVAS